MISEIYPLNWTSLFLSPTLLDHPLILQYSNIECEVSFNDGSDFRVCDDAWKCTNDMENQRFRYLGGGCQSGDQIGSGGAGGGGASGGGASGGMPPMSGPMPPMSGPMPGMSGPMPSGGPNDGTFTIRSMNRFDSSTLGTFSASTHIMISLTHPLCKHLIAPWHYQQDLAPLPAVTAETCSMSATPSAVDLTTSTGMFRFTRATGLVSSIKAIP